MLGLDQASFGLSHYKLTFQMLCEEQKNAVYKSNYKLERKPQPQSNIKQKLQDIEIEAQERKKGTQGTWRLFWVVSGLEGGGESPALADECAINALFSSTLYRIRQF